MIEGDRYLFGFEAAQFVWNTLWKRDQPSHVDMNTLDVIQLSGGAIIGWLFTSSDGTVKSKLQSRWNNRSVVERATKLSLKHEIQCNFYNTFLNKFITIQSDESLKETLHEKHVNPTVILTYAHLTGSNLSYMESVYEYPVTIVKSAPPKLTNYTLCASKSLGKVVNTVKRSVHDPEPIQSLPSERIICLNKLTNATLKDFHHSFVKVIEARHKVRVTKCTLILLVETISQSELLDLPAGSATEIQDKRAWLHHCSELVYSRHINSQRRPVMSDMNSEQGTMSNLSTEFTLATAGIRIAKLGLTCNGDFCYYNSAENRDNFDLFDDADENIKEESSRAIARHRPKN